jgi:hypothetical protein
VAAPAAAQVEGFSPMNVAVDEAYVAAIEQVSWDYWSKVVKPGG